MHNAYSTWNHNSTNAGVYDLEYPMGERLRKVWFTVVPILLFDKIMWLHMRGGRW